MTTTFQYSCQTIANEAIALLQENPSMTPDSAITYVCSVRVMEDTTAADDERWYDARTAKRILTPDSTSASTGPVFDYVVELVTAGRN